MRPVVRGQLVYIASMVSVACVWWFVLDELPPWLVIVGLAFPLAWFWNAVLDSNEAYRLQQEAETSPHPPAYGEPRGEGEGDE